MVARRKSLFMSWLDQQPKGTADRIHKNLEDIMAEKVLAYKQTGYQTFDILAEREHKVFSKMRNQALNQMCKNWKGTTSIQFIKDFKKFIRQNSKLWLYYKRIP